MAMIVAHIKIPAFFPLTVTIELIIGMRTILKIGRIDVRLLVSRRVNLNLTMRRSVEVLRNLK